MSKSLYNALGVLAVILLLVGLSFIVAGRQVFDAGEDAMATAAEELYEQGYDPTQMPELYATELTVAYEQGEKKKDQGGLLVLTGIPCALVAVGIDWLRKRKTQNGFRY